MWGGGRGGGGGNGNEKWIRDVRLQMLYQRIALRASSYRIIHIVIKNFEERYWVTKKEPLKPELIQPLG